MSIFAPRKDQCVKFGQRNLPSEDWEFHRNKKDQAQHAKAVDNELARHDNVLETTMDLSTVLLSPGSMTAALYDKTKLCCHSFTVYELDSHKVQNYMKLMGDSPPMNLPPVYITTQKFPVDNQKNEQKFLEKGHTYGMWLRSLCHREGNFRCRHLCSFRLCSKNKISTCQRRAIRRGVCWLHFL